MRVRQRAQELGKAQSIPWATIIEAILAAIENCDSERAARVDPDVGKIILRRRLKAELLDEGMTRREARTAAKNAAEAIFEVPEEERRDCICELRGGAIA